MDLLITERKFIWSELLSLIGYYIEAWCLGGDFNMTKSKGSDFQQVEWLVAWMRKFNKFIEEWKLIEVILLNRKLTWSREGRVVLRSLLDRFLVTFDRDKAFANTRVTRQVRISSNHFPFLLEAGAFEWEPSPFRFCNSWLLDKNCCQFIENSLTTSTPPSWMGFALSTQLQNIKGQLKSWHSDCERKQKSHEETLLKAIALEEKKYDQPDTCTGDHLLLIREWIF